MIESLNIEENIKILIIKAIAKYRFRKEQALVLGIDEKTLVKYIKIYNL